MIWPMFDICAGLQLEVVEREKNVEWNQWIPLHRMVKAGRLR